MSPRALLTLTVLPDRYAICRFDGKAPVPQWAIGDDFVSISRTRDELSIICPERNVPQGTACSGGWRILKCEGPLDYNLIGIERSLAFQNSPTAGASRALWNIAFGTNNRQLIARARNRDKVIANGPLRHRGLSVETTNCVAIGQDGQRKKCSWAHFALPTSSTARAISFIISASERLFQQWPRPRPYAIRASAGGSAVLRNSSSM